MTANNEALTASEQNLLRELVSRHAASGAVMAVVGELSGEAAKIMLREIAQTDGKMICVNSFPDVVDEAAALKRNPDQITREAFLRHARQGGYRESVTLVNGNAANLAGLLAPESVDLLFLACRGGYEVQRATWLAWFPVVRQAGLLFGTGFATADPAEGYAGVVVGSEAAARFAPAPRAVTRLVTDMVPESSVSGRIWVADKGLRGEAVAVIASGMHQTKVEGNRIERKHRALLKKALHLGENAETARERIGMLEQIARDFPQYLEPHLMLGEQFMELNLLDEAIRVYERSLKNKTGNAQVYGRLGAAHRAKGDLGSAEAYLLSSVRCDRTHLTSWLSLAMLYVEGGATERAINAVAHGLDVAPPDLEPVSVLCRMSLALGEPTTMQKALQLMRRLDPDHELAQKLSQRIGGSAPVVPQAPRAAVAAKS